jgi:hypothetical protein
MDDVNGWLVGDVKLGERSLSAVLVAMVLALQIEIDEPDSQGEQGALQETEIRIMYIASSRKPCVCAGLPRFLNPVWTVQLYRLFAYS